MTIKKISIGSLVDFNVTNDIKGMGVVLGMSAEAAPDVRFWIVLLLRRDTEFLKQRPEKAIVMLESTLKPTESIISPQVNLLLRDIDGIR